MQSQEWILPIQIHNNPGFDPGMSSLVVCWGNPYNEVRSFHLTDEEAEGTER